MTMKRNAMNLIHLLSVDLSIEADPLLKAIQADELTLSLVRQWGRNEIEYPAISERVSQLLTNKKRG